MAVAAPVDEPDVARRCAPWPTSPRHSSPSAGAPMIPNSGAPSLTSARLTVNSLRPAIYSLVPSRGSIRKKLPRSDDLAEVDALLGDGRNGWRKPRQALPDDPVGDEVRVRHRRSVRLAVDIQANAADRQNSGAGPNHEVGQRLHQRAAVSRSITGPDKSASLMGVLNIRVSHSCLRCDPPLPTRLFCQPLWQFCRGRKGARNPDAPCWHHAYPQCIKPAIRRDSYWSEPR